MSKKKASLVLTGCLFLACVSPILAENIVFPGYPLDISNDLSPDGNGNKVTINSGSIHNVYGSTGGLTALGNSVFIKGGTMENVYGGFAPTAINNHVVVSGGKVIGNVVGGGSSFGSTTHNTVTLFGKPDLRQATLYGGLNLSMIPGDIRTGNTLNLHPPITVKGLQNFEFLNFYLPATIKNGGTMLRVTDTAGLGVGAVVNVHPGAALLHVGDTITLIRGGTVSGSLTSDTLIGSGALMNYNFDLTMPGDQLRATVTDAELRPQSIALSEGYITGMALLDQTGDRITAISHGNRAFLDISSSDLRYNTGSHVDVSGFSLLTGLSRHVRLTHGHLIASAFFEYGNGDYDTYNSFPHAASVQGEGNVHHLGGGILGRVDFRTTGLYTEGSFRIGNVQNNFDSAGLGTNYNSSSSYRGIHFGGGTVQKITSKTSLDLYSKFTWTWQGSSSVTLSSGEWINFQTVNAQRLKIGGRFSNTVNNHLSVYYGAAWEQGFDGLARATFGNYAFGTPSLRGSTGMGELGVTWKSARKFGLHSELGLQGYMGKREGATATISIGRTF